MKHALDFQNVLTYHYHVSFTVFLDAIKNFNGGAKQARNLEDISPKFIV